MWDINDDVCSEKCIYKDLDRCKKIEVLVGDEVLKERDRIMLSVLLGSLTWFHMSLAGIGYELL